MKGNKYVRKMESKETRMLAPFWCDYCRTFTDDEKKHRHEDPVY